MFDLYLADGVLNDVPDMSPLRILLDSERALIERLVMLSQDSVDQHTLFWVVEREGPGAIQVLLRNPSLELLQLRQIHDLIRKRWKFNGSAFAHQETSPFLNLLLSHPSTTDKFRAEVLDSVEVELLGSTSVQLLRLMHASSQKEWSRRLAQFGKKRDRLNYQDILLTGKHYPEDLWAIISPQPRFSADQLEAIVAALPLKTAWGKDVAAIMLQNPRLSSGTRLQIIQQNSSPEALISLASNPGITPTERGLISHRWGGDPEFRTRRTARKLSCIPNMWLLGDLYFFLRPTAVNAGSFATVMADQDVSSWGDHPGERHYVKNILENPGCSDALWEDVFMRSTPEDLAVMSDSIIRWHDEGKINRHRHTELVDIFTYHRGFPPAAMESVFSADELLRMAKRLSFADLRKVLQVTCNKELLANIEVQPGDHSTRSILILNPATPPEVRDHLRHARRAGA